MRKLRLGGVILCSMLLFACACSKSKQVGSGEESSDKIPTAQAGTELKDINYNFDSANLDANAKGILRDNAKWLQDNPDHKVVVEGHCDERGTAEYNLALGERRAKSAFEFLKTLGVKADRMQTISYGEEIPLDPRKTEEAYAKNRRAHFTLGNK